jgi:hypothetical protein
MKVIRYGRVLLYTFSLNENDDEIILSENDEIGSRGKR